MGLSTVPILPNLGLIKDGDEQKEQDRLGDGEGGRGNKGGKKHCRR